MAMRDGYDDMCKRQTWMGMIVLLVALLLAGVVPAHAWHGAHVFIEPSIVVPFGPYWAPYVYPYAYPPVVVQPPPQVYVQPSPPPTYWYYCDNPPGYYPYVQQCSSRWRSVAPTPP